MEQRHIRDRDVEKLDYAILKAVYQMDVPPWKKRLHAYVTAEKEVLPGKEVSEQTVGRHVDKLTDEDLLETVIVSTRKLEDVDRSHMIGYKVTETGMQSLREKRDEILRDKVVTTIAPLMAGNFDELDVNREVTLELIKDEFGLEMEEAVEEGLKTAELLCILSTYYANQQVCQNIDEDSIKRIAEAAAGNQELTETILQPSLVERIRRYLPDTAPVAAEAKA